MQQYRPLVILDPSCINDIDYLCHWHHSCARSTNLWNVADRAQAALELGLEMCSAVWALHTWRASVDGCVWDTAHHKCIVL